MLFLEKSANALKTVRPGAYKRWNPVWNTLPSTFISFIFQYCCSSSLEDMYSLDQYYYPAPGWRNRKLCPLPLSPSIALISEVETLLLFHCSNFWSPVLLLFQPWLFFALGIPSSPSALHIYTTANTNHSQGWKNVPHTPQIKAGMQNSAVLN